MNKRTDESLITVAEQLGITYVHLYLVLHRKRVSQGLLFTVMRRYPFVLDKLDANTRWINKADWKMNGHKFIWDNVNHKYILKPSYRK